MSIDLSERKNFSKACSSINLKLLDKRRSLQVLPRLIPQEDKEGPSGIEL